MGIWDIASLVAFEVPICMVGPGATGATTDFYDEKLPIGVQIGVQN